MKKTIITLDGHSGCGKSTLAKLLAKELNFLYIDTGAMYRAISLFFLETNQILKNGKLNSDFKNILDSVNIDFSKPNKNGESWVRLNGEIVEDKIRNIEISNLVSEISKNALVRNKMVLIQQSYSAISNLIMDGRDIGSVVFPNADIKFWVTASAEKRAYRRWLEYKLKGKNISIEQVTKNINFRDENDQNRKISPLIKPLNSIIIDSTDMNIEQTFNFALTHIQNYLKK
ncbi:MAG: cytidylate kinase [Crocinitomicaceae bacterium]|nr:cytidylate kinase [Crocinitomicaceae bacterium]|tara:strand:- start:13809 stop:14498 length:690 start_codon:yes stop_codon:yes gene_type:complete